MFSGFSLPKVYVDVSCDDDGDQYEARIEDFVSCELLGSAVDKDKATAIGKAVLAAKRRLDEKARE
jgi:hypothetical protein